MRTKRHRVVKPMPHSGKSQRRRHKLSGRTRRRRIGNRQCSQRQPTLTDRGRKRAQQTQRELAGKPRAHETFDASITSRRLPARSLSVEAKAFSVSPKDWTPGFGALLLNWLPPTRGVSTEHQDDIMDTNKLNTILLQSRWTSRLKPIRNN